MLARQLIERKREGGRLAAAEWRGLVRAYTAGDVPDYQMAAFLMAAYLNGLDSDEAAGLTGAMLESGSHFGRVRGIQAQIDKHSTGGVGDKVSLVLAPLVAAVGVDVPMIAGRNLGHTGGTLDKLESIPGFQTALSLARARKQLAATGCVMIGQTDEIAPADRMLYALRDATGTVASIPLIAASIMSKKLAEDLTGLVLDVKRGAGAFLPELPRALELAQLMIQLGREYGVPVVALVTAMDRPLGWACGNALEMEEAIHVLTGAGPADVRELTLALGTEMLLLAEPGSSVATHRVRLERALASGAAARKLQEIIAAQGGNPGVVDDPGALPQANREALFRAPRAGIVARIDPRRIGEGVIELGGGRTRVGDAIDPTVGFVIRVAPGAAVGAGEPIASVFARDAEGLALGERTLNEAIQIGDRPASTLPLISHRVTSEGVEECTSNRAIEQSN